MKAKFNFMQVVKMTLLRSLFPKTKFLNIAYLSIILVLLGVLFRFNNLDLKVYWRDEALTSMQVAGYSQAEFLKDAFNSQITVPSELQYYQEMSRDKNLFNTVKVLSEETPEHPPLYFILLHIWVFLFGSSVIAYRSFSALISLLVLPAIYWLCLELFNSRRVGYFGVVIAAVSPFFVAYAQEAREYSLWTVAILISSQALLRAMRLNTRKNWGIYAIALIFSFYTYLFSIFVLAAHGVYVFTIGKFRFDKTFVSYILASGLGLLAFLPWIMTFIIHLSAFRRSMSWSFESHHSLFELVRFWSTLPRFLFFDIDLPRIGFFSTYYFWALTTSAIAIYAIYFVVHNSRKETWLFILILSVIPFLFLALPDLIIGGSRSTNARYLTPSFLGIELSVAYLFSTQISLDIKQKAWRIGFAILVSTSLTACIISSSMKYSFAKDGQAVLKVSDLVNRSPEPLVISNNYAYNPTNILSLSRKLDPKVRMQLLDETKTPVIPSGFKTYFFYSPQLPQSWKQFVSNSLFKPIKVGVDREEILWVYEK
jgi:uncharacterized membrane protein